MFQAANTVLFNPLFPKTRNSEWSVKIYYFLHKLSQLKLIGRFIFFASSALMRFI